MLFQIHGTKKITIGKFKDLETERAEAERYYGGGHRNISDDAVRRERVRHGPWRRRPHSRSGAARDHEWAGILDLALDLVLLEGEREVVDVYAMNARLRRLGLSPKHPGERDASDRLKVGAWRGMRQGRDAGAQASSGRALAARHSPATPSRKQPGRRAEGRARCLGALVNRRVRARAAASRRPARAPGSSPGRHRVWTSGRRPRSAACRLAAEEHVDLFDALLDRGPDRVREEQRRRRSSAPRRDRSRSGRSRNGNRSASRGRRRRVRPRSPRRGGATNPGPTPAREIPQEDAVARRRDRRALRHGEDREGGRESNQVGLRVAGSTSRESRTECALPSAFSRPRATRWRNF